MSARRKRVTLSEAKGTYPKACPPPTLPARVAPLDQAKALLAQTRAALLKDEPNSDAEAVATTTAGEGILGDGTSVSFPIEVK